MDPFTLLIYIYFAVNALIVEEYIDVSDIFVDYTNDNEDDDILGTLHITDFTITGLDTITSLMGNIVVSDEDEHGNNNACMYLPIGNLQFTANYTADIGIANEIPIYGDGNILFAMSDIDLHVCAFFNYTLGIDFLHIDDVTSNFTFRHNPIEFTGFLRNKQVSEILERWLNIGNIFLAMWSAYEPDKAGCLINPLLQYVMNLYKEYENNTFLFDTVLPCLQGSFIDDIVDYDNLKDYFLTVVEDDKSDSSLKEFLNDNDTRSIILELINPLIKKIRDIHI